MSSLVFMTIQFSEAENESWYNNQLPFMACHLKMHHYEPLMVLILG